MRTTSLLTILVAISAAHADIPEVRPQAAYSALPAMHVNNQCLGVTEREAPQMPTRSMPSYASAPPASLGGVVAGPTLPATSKMAESSRARANYDATSRNDAVSHDAAHLTDDTPTSTPRQAPSQNWGGTIQLSNDDAMSLASAQRVLWALEHHAPIQTSQIRPHELLNYFSFTATKPENDGMISVTPSVVHDQDTLKLALNVQVATPPRPPLDLTLLVDRSGSMRAENRMGYVRKALHLVQKNLVSGDRVDLVLFDHTSCAAITNFVVGRDDASALRHLIDGIAPRGSTNLDAGLRNAYDIARDHKAQGPDSRSGRVMVFSDAILNTGNVDVDVLSEVGTAMTQDGIRLTGVGVGTDFRDDVFDVLTEKGQGAYVFLGSERVVDRLFNAGFNALVQVAAVDARFALTLPDSLGMKRFYGEESSRSPQDIAPVMLAAGSHQVFFQDLRIKAGTLQPNDLVTFEASWTHPTTGRREGQTYQWRVGELLRLDARNATKAVALMRFSDLLLARAMGAPSCGEPYHTMANAFAKLPDDAELNWLKSISIASCPPLETLPEVQPSTTAKIRVDADQWISEVTLDCGSGPQIDTLMQGERVASFQTTAGQCDLTLHGAVPFTTQVLVASTGSQIDCRIRAGRVACDGQP